MPQLIDNTTAGDVGYYKVFQDSNGFFYAVYANLISSTWRTYIRSSRDNWATEKVLFSVDATDSPIITQIQAYCANGCLTNDKLHLNLSAKPSTTWVHAYTVCVDLALWNSTSGWMQTNETSTGYTTVEDGGSTTNEVLSTYSETDFDDQGNLYMIYTWWVPSLSGSQEVRIKKRTASTKTWSSPSTVKAARHDGPSVLVDSMGFIHVLYGWSYVYYKKSTNPRDITSWSSETTLMGSGVSPWNSWRGCFLGEYSSPGKIVAVSTTPDGSGGGTGVPYTKWNYYDGSAWTQATGTGGGSTTGLDQGSNLKHVSSPTRGTMDGAKNVYVQQVLNSQSAYTIYRFEKTTWSAHKTISVGGSDVEGSPQLQKRNPSTKALGGFIYGDEASGGADEVHFDKVSCEPKELFDATRIVSLVEGDGTDTDIQTAINNLPAIGGKVFIKAGTYLISSPIIIGKSNVTIEGEGPNSSIIRASGWSPTDKTRAMIEGVPKDGSTQTDLSHILIRRLQLDGNERGGGTKFPLAALLLGRNDLTSGYKVDDAEIANLRIYDCKYYGLKFEAFTDTPTPGSRRINLRATIHDCALEAVGTSTVREAGMSLGGLQFSVVRGNVVSNWGFVGINPDGCQDLVLEGNICTTNRGGGIFVEDGSGDVPPARISIVGNVCVDNFGDSSSGLNRNPGIGVTNGNSTSTLATSITISGNVCSGNKNAQGNATSAGIALHGVENSIIADNVSKNNDYGYGIYFGKGNQDAQGGPNGQPCRGLIITNNKCFDDQATKKQVNGLYIAESVTDVTLAGNDFSGNSGSEIGFASGKSMGTRGANPMGISLSVSVPTQGQNYVDVNLPWTQADTNYIAIAVPSWDTTVRVHVSEKTTTQVKFRFGAGAPLGGGTVDVLFVR